MKKPYEGWPTTKTATLDLSHDAGTYDALTAQGDVLIEAASFYGDTAGATFTSVSVQTNQTNPVTVLTSAEGAVANVVAQKTLAFAYGRFPFVLRSGQKLQYTIVGLTGTGAITMTVYCRPLVSGQYATLV
jgi:hypothetical protein